MSYDLLKLAHLVAVILWIGPALGGYIVLFRVWRRGDEAAITSAEEDCERVLRLEHAAFLLLVVSGVAMLASTDWALLQPGWMAQKLLIFGLIAAFEAYDMWLSHRVLPRAFGVSSDPDLRRKALLQRAWLMRLAVPVGLLIVLVLWLAVTREPLG